LELGVTLCDTADVYGEGENEKSIAPFAKAHRDEVVLATKFSLSIDPDEPARRIIRNNRAYMRSCVENSLRRLGDEEIDLYYLHRRDVNVPIEETVGAMAALARVHQRAAVHGPAVVPIPGNRNRGRLEENTAATRLVHHRE
jgi:aryl-alcohol dehydrogenase-like predicted oxidoreductase